MGEHGEQEHMTAEAIQSIVTEYFMHAEAGSLGQQDGVLRSDLIRKIVELAEEQQRKVGPHVVAQRLGRAFIYKYFIRPALESLQSKGAE